MPKLVEMLAHQPVMSVRDICRRLTVGVAGEAGAASGLRLLTTLASIFPVEFRSCTEGNGDDLDGLIVLGLDPERIRMAASTGLPVFAVAAQPSTAAPRKSTEIRFGEDLALSVCWASPKGAARACYQFREAGEVLHVKLGSRRVEVGIEQGVREVVVHRPWLHGKDESELMVLQGEGKELFREVSSAAVLGPIPMDGSTVLEVSSSLLNEVDCSSVSAPVRRFWPLALRFLAEVRDRSLLGVYLRGQVDNSSGRQARSCETGDA